MKKYPKYACPGNPDCGVASPERPTSLVEGDRYDTSVAAAVVEAKWFHHLPIYRHQDVFAGSGWTPSRSTLLNLVSQVAVRHHALHRVHDPAGPAGRGRGHRRHELPDALAARRRRTVIPGDAKSQRLAEKVAEARAKGDSSLLAKMWVYSGLLLGAVQHLRLPRVAASGRPRRLLPPQPLYGARRLLFGKPERRDPQRRTFDVRRLLGACAPQGRGGDDVREGKRTAAGNDPGAVRHRDPRQGSDLAGSSGVAQRESTVVLDAMWRWLDTTPLAGRAAQERLRGGVAVHSQPLEGTQRLRPRRSHPHRQQFGGAVDEAGGDGPQGVAVRLRRGRGRAERDDDDPGEQRTAARPRRRGLRQRRAGPVAGGSHGLRPPAARRLEAKPPGGDPRVPGRGAARQSRTQATPGRPPSPGRPSPPVALAPVVTARRQMVR